MYSSAMETQITFPVIPDIKNHSERRSASRLMGPLTEMGYIALAAKQHSDEITSANGALTLSFLSGVSKFMLGEESTETNRSAHFTPGPHAYQYPPPEQRASTSRALGDVFGASAVSRMVVQYEVETDRGLLPVSSVALGVTFQDDPKWWLGYSRLSVATSNDVHTMRAAFGKIDHTGVPHPIVEPIFGTLQEIGDHLRKLRSHRII